MPKPGRGPGPKAPDYDPVLRRCLELTDSHSEREMCRTLGITPRVLIARKHSYSPLVDDTTITVIAHRYHVYEEWLQTGRGPKDRPAFERQVPADVAAFAYQLAKVAVEDRQLLARCLDYLTDAQPLHRQVIKCAIIIVDNITQDGWRLLRDCPD